MDQFRDRLFVNGWDRTKAVWTVPQGFGNETSVSYIITAPYVTDVRDIQILEGRRRFYLACDSLSNSNVQRFPTGKEFVVESILGINHGGLGLWIML